ncbi:hypothetical protein C8F01DRAFT_66538 [Mycena amicta]|nr:hypothetical protein C8F01DRAFT_66538 [Mycena amicta]
MALEASFQDGLLRHTRMSPRFHALHLLLPRRSGPLPLFSRDTDDDSSVATENRAAPSTTPPSYRAAMRDGPIKTAFKPTASTAARQRVAQARERGGSVLNAADTWKKIQMEGAEADADRFHQDRLLERCWQVWKGGHQWIVETNSQVAQARDNHVLRLCIHRWRLRTAASQDRFDSIVHLADGFHLRSAFGKWKARAKQKQQARWRADMRTKMKLVRDKRDRKLLLDALQSWKQAHQTRVAARHHMYSLVAQYFGRWKQKTVHLDRLDDRADEFSRVVDRGVLERCWYYWKHTSQLQIGYHIVADNVGLRVKTEVMDVWKRRLRKIQTAHAFHDILIKKNAMRLWKAARHRLRALTLRANVHEHGRDQLLLYAAYKTIRTRYVGRKLEWITQNRRLMEAWRVWKMRIRQQKTLEDNAIAFSLRPSSCLGKAALRKWHQVYSRDKNALIHAASCHSILVRRRFYLAWKTRLEQQRIKSSKALAIHKRFLLRSGWIKIRVKFAERQRQTALEIFELRKTQRVFYDWFERAYRRRSFRLAEQEIEDRIVHRILKNALTRWTNRTIDVKNREFQASLDRDACLLNDAFKRWRSARSSHAEEIRLMESYRFVKREENLRKIFYRWLSAARTTSHRRLTLERKETEMHFAVISVAWDKWRYRFMQKKLQPMEDAVILQRHHNALARTFATWRGRTKSLPAIRFDASHLKAKYWKTWLRALPRALQSKDASIFDRRTILTKCFNKWLQLHRTKAALKAVARARYMRLPTSTRAIPPRTNAVPFVARSGFPRRSVRTEEHISDDEGSVDDEPTSWRYRQARSLRSDPSPPRRSRFSVPVTRASSPARSSAGPRSGREVGVTPRREPGTLFRELRQLQPRPSASGRT